MSPVKGPQKAAEDTLDVGKHHLAESTQLTFVKNIYGALLLSAGGLLSLILETGSPSLSASNPGLGQLLRGLGFPSGLVLVYLVGAELFTGYPMWFAMTALERSGRPIEYVRGAIVSWVGNFIGAAFFAAVFTHFTEILAEEPFRSGTVHILTEDIIEQKWHVIFLRAIVCGFLVTLAMFLGTQCHDGVSKTIALHLPFFISVAAKCPHAVEYMYLGVIGMLLGSPLSIGGLLWKCLLPITLGNIIGGAVFTGAYMWWVFLVCGDEKAGQGSGWGAVSLGNGGPE
ncbi:hypothetical protein LTR37_019063 [Vermiconidia calcicola]|uniref:Uncharacterized protein n=1 Tax=Vermiconidia calcicola TaxID=1690605 RepID=A0ACC3MGZ9_9PEZI|nr:hypothetical protein LTR37_019063 [Vermiconidia calcicola]